MCVSVCVCVSCWSRLLNVNTGFMTGSVKTEQKQGHNLLLPLSTRSSYLCISPLSSLSPRKSISRSRHSKVHYSLLPAAFCVCYPSHSHYLFLLPSLSSLYLDNQTWCSSSCCSFCLTACVSQLPLTVPDTSCSPICVPLQSVYADFKHYFKLYFSTTPSPPLLPYSLPDSPPLLLHALYHFWQRKLKKEENLCKCWAEKWVFTSVVWRKVAKRLITIFSLCCGSAGL